MKWLDKVVEFLIHGHGECVEPPWNVPLEDVPGQLMNSRLKYHSSGKIEVVEWKFNLKEYERIKPILDKIVRP